MDLAIVILLAMVTLIVGIILVMAVRLINDLATQIDRLDRRIRSLKAFEEEQRMHSFVAGLSPAEETSFTFRLVTDDDDPLDFPNDSAKKGE